MPTHSTSLLAEDRAPLRLGRLRLFVEGMAAIIERSDLEEQIITEGKDLLAELVRHDDWLPPEFAAPDPSRYQQYLLHCDSARRFSVVSFVWGPGQSTPVHDHTLWGMVGILRGAEISQPYIRTDSGIALAGPAVRLEVGQIDCVSPKIGDIHKVSNALPDAPSVSIHVYGGDIGSVRRTAFAADGAAKPFISGYSNRMLPNIWREA